MCGVSADAQLLERALDVVAKRRAGQRLEQRAAEIERAQLRDRQAGGQPLERLAVDPPARPAIVVRLVVEEREAGFLERLQIAADRARRDVAQRRELVDRDARAARALDLAQDRPLTDDFGVAGHASL